MYKVLLIDEYNGNEYKKFECEDRFTCEVYVYQHLYDTPNMTHFEIYEDTEEN